MNSNGTFVLTPTLLSDTYQYLLPTMSVDNDTYQK